MHCPPIHKAGMFWIMSNHPLFKPGHASIVDNDIGDRNSLSQPKPVGLLPHIQLFESATDLRRRCNSGNFIQIGDDDIATFFVKARSNCAANPTRSTRDDAYLTIQSLHIVLDQDGPAARSNSELGEVVGASA